jgi:hypothetical protein
VLLVATVVLSMTGMADAFGTNNPAPAPLIGVGGPITGAVAGAVVATLYIARRFRRKD